VHYYFRSMDDLFIEIFRRRAEDDSRSSSAPSPATRRCGSCGGSTPTRAAPPSPSSSSRWPTIQEDPGRDRPLCERFRAAQLNALTAAMDRAGVTEEQLPPVVGLLLMTGLSQVLALEQRWASPAVMPTPRRTSKARSPGSKPVAGADANEED